MGTGSGSGVGAGGRSKGGVRALFQRALTVEADRLDVLRARGWVGVGGATIAICVFNLLVISHVSGAGDGREMQSGIFVGLFMIAWFLPRALWPGRFRLIARADVVVEGAMPMVYYGVTALHAGVGNATSTIAPPMLLCAALMLSAFRLDPKSTFILGATTVVLHYVVSTVLVIPGLDDAHLPKMTPFTAADVYASGVAFFFSAVVGTALTAGLRSAVGHVVRSMRAEDLFGKYRLDKQLASGGMGVVWRATYCPEGGFERPAAVKLVHAHLADDAAFIESFRAEAELSARLVHPNIAQVFDFGRADNRWFLAMEFIDGITLLQLLRAASSKSAPLPEPVVSAVALAVLRALDYAHREAVDARGARLHIVHRDVAPANVLIGKNGEVKLTDFGIARARGKAAAVMTTSIVGHVTHMAPEQVEARELDERTDLFAVGVLLWEMLTGKALFKRDNELATLRAVADAVVAAPSTLRAQVTSWDAPVLRALSKDPRDRFQSAAEMAAAIECVARGAGDDVVRFCASIDAWSEPASTPASRTSPTLLGDLEAETVKAAPAPL